MSGEDIRSYTIAELREMRARGGSMTDWARLEAMTEEESEAAIRDDPDSDVPPGSLYDTDLVDPAAGTTIFLLPVDTEVVRWFRAAGPDWRERMNAALRRHVEASTRRAAE